MSKRLKLSTPQEVRRGLARVANMVLNEQLDSKAANAITLACNAILGAMRVDEQERKLQELERMMEELIKK